MAFVAAVRTAIRTGDRYRSYQTALKGSETNAPEPVVDALLKAQREPPRDFITQQGWVMLALQNAFYHLLHSDTFEHAVIATIRNGGDTDTNAAICGALFGALQGRAAIPLQWRKMILSCHPMAGFPHIHQPRPFAVWPVDAMILAEQSLLAGSGNL